MNRQERNAGITIIELLITTGVMVVLLGVGMGFLRARGPDQQERAAMDALSNMIISASRQASALNRNVILVRQGDAVVAQECPATCLGGGATMGSIEPVDIALLSAPAGTQLMGVRADGVMVFQGHSLNTVFGNLAWSNRTVFTGRNQRYLLDVSRYGDAVICDGASATSCTGAVQR